nr:VWA domain-containing protein [uncultured Desulfosarcina sp.]
MQHRIALFAFLSYLIFSSFGYPQDVPAPAINPLGDISAYTTSELSKNTVLEVHIPEGEDMRTKELKGDIWYMNQDAGGDQEEIRRQLKVYGESIGAEFLRWDAETALLRKDMGNGEVWWCNAVLEDGMRLTVVKTLRIDPGKPVTFSLGEGGRNEVRFFADNPGGKYRSLSVTVPQGEVSLSAEQIMQTGAYKRTINGKWFMDGGRATRFSIDAIPQEAGTCYYTLYTNPGTPATDIGVELIEHPFPIPKVEMGEKLGALRIKNVPYGLARIKTDNRFGVIYIEHPEFPAGAGFETGDVTPEGDSYFMLPAGLWQVEVMPVSQDKATAVRAQFVPVHAGWETVLDWPLAMTTVFGDESGSGIKINAITPKDGEAEVIFSLQGSETKSIVPTPDSLEIKEGGNRGTVISVRRTTIPLDIVLLVDSSGSMKGQMQNALAATIKFIEALPDTARVRVVDFDTQPKKIPGTTKAEALKGLAGIKANGATCLNDSVLLGLGMLTEAKRPTLLLFTDGFDANYDDSGPGSQATKEDVLKAVGGAKIPVFTIGFGPDHDVNTLDRIASLSGGRYYAASDPTALEKAFAVIQSNLSNTFTARYARPAKGRPSDVPVVTCMVDISGSMNTTPDMDGCGYRIDKVKTILHDFFTALPDNVLAQAVSFRDENAIEQVTTANMGEVLAALTDLDPDGGTDISGAVDAAIQIQAAIPSNKRYMLFITDAALEVDGEDKLRFDTTLAKLKDEGIYCLWVGIGALNPAPFKHAAELSGGNSILTEDPAELAKAFQTMIQDIKKPSIAQKDVKSLVEVTLKHREKSGRNLSFASAAQAVMPVRPTDNSVAIPAAISHSLTELRERYDPMVAAMVTGDSVPIRDAKIGKRIPMGVTGGNKAASFTVGEAFFMHRLRGLNPPTGFRYLVLTMEMKNILSEQRVLVYPDGSNHPASWVGNDAATTGKEVLMVPTYVIPDLKRHLFLRWNNQTMTPLSPATWLTEAPLIMPGEDAVAIPPGKPVAGALVFLVPEGIMKQMSLHYYDTNYGHADIPLVGTMAAGIDRASTLPAKPPAKLSDAFSLAIREVKDVRKIGTHEAGDGAVFRIVEADFVSNVQALLDLNPTERFSLRLNTKEGALGVRLHNVTGLLPLGFLAPTMLSPGSNNRIRLAFRVPKQAAKEAGIGELVVDVRGCGVVIPLDERAAKAPAVIEPGDSMRGNGINLVVNALERYGDDEEMYVADITIFDAKDGQSTAMSDAFILKKKGYKEPDGTQVEAAMPDFGKTKGLAGFATGNALIPVGTMPPDSTTDDLVFGITDATVVPDGTSLRGLIVFKLPYGDTDPDDWQLSSSLFPSLAHPLDTNKYKHERLLIRRVDVEYDYNSSYLAELNAAVAKIRRQREARDFKRPGHYRPKVLDGNGKTPPARSVPVPEATGPGLKDFAAIKDLATLKKRLATVRYLPTVGMGWQHLFAPQAVLTQNWCSEGDLARMAEIVLARQGITTRRVTVAVTDKGLARLSTMAGLSEATMSSLPALLYHDGKGNRHVLVAPFLEPMTKLGGIVEKVLSNDVSPAEMTATVTVNLLVKAKKGGQSKSSRELSDALSGDTDTSGVEPFFLLTANPTLPELSRGAVDIGYTVVGQKAGPVVKAIFDGNDKRTIGSETLDTGEYEIVGERIQIDLGFGELTFERWLQEGESIVDRFHTLGLNLPDMRLDAVRRLDKAMQTVHRGEDAPDNLSALKWYARNALYKFVCAQSEYESDLARTMNLVVGRTTKPRCIVVTVSRAAKDGPVSTAIDLRQTANQIHPSSGATDQARHGFNIASGIFASKLEAGILPGSMGFFEMLSYFAADTEFLWLTADARYRMADRLKAAMPEHVLELLTDNPATVLFPSHPAVINGVQRWAWLEVNPNTYETIAVLDTGERGAMVERVFSDLWKDGLDYVTGGLVGVSSSIWSVSAFSLILDDYKQIMTEAKKFTLGLADRFSGSVKVGDFEVKRGVGGSDLEGSYTGLKRHRQGPRDQGHVRQAQGT